MYLFSGNYLYIMYRHSSTSGNTHKLPGIIVCDIFYLLFPLSFMVFTWCFRRENKLWCLHAFQKNSGFLLTSSKNLSFNLFNLIRLLLGIRKACIYVVFPQQLCMPSKIWKIIRIFRAQNLHLIMQWVIVCLVALSDL